jgi:peptidoglycan/LPS O-acetylase OafA/YrhL
MNIRDTFSESAAAEPTLQAAADRNRFKSKSSAASVAPMLDLLRFAAAALVMCAHLRDNQFMGYTEVECASGPIKFVFFQTTRLGTESVLLFFVLSGFLVGGTSVDRFLRGTFDVTRYAIDRMTRIYVPFVPALALVIAKCMWLALPFSWFEAGINLVSLQGIIAPPFSGNTALWSLSYEVWFYTASGALLAVLQWRSGVATGVGVGLLACSVLVFSQLDLAYCASWAIGVGAYFITAPRRKLLVLAAAGLAITGLVLMQLTSVSRQIDIASFHWINRSIAVLTLSTGFGLIVAACSHVRVESTIMRQVATISGFLSSFCYTLYLMHNPIFDVLRYFGLLRRLDHLNVITFGVYLGNAAIVLLASFSLYLLFERQTVQVRNFLYQVRLFNALK